MAIFGRGPILSAPTHSASQSGHFWTRSNSSSELPLVLLVEYDLAERLTLPRAGAAGGAPRARGFLLEVCLDCSAVRTALRMAERQLIPLPGMKRKRDAKAKRVHTAFHTTTTGLSRPVIIAALAKAHKGPNKQGFLDLGITAATSRKRLLALLHSTELDPADCGRTMVAARSIATNTVRPES